MQKATYIVAMRHLGGEPFIAHSTSEDELTLRIKSWMFDGTEVLDLVKVDAVWKAGDAVSRLRHKHGSKRVIEIKNGGCK